jgi:hypothetical protein
MINKPRTKLEILYELLPLILILLLIILICIKAIN